MIERHAQQSELICDECVAAAFGPREDFDVLMTDAHDTGWRTFKRDGAWQHSCPDCVENWKLGRGRLDL